MRRLALVPLTIGVLLFPPVASALGLGEIEMQSALNQRLDAEIPLRGVDPEQTGAIIVTLASEEAFRQVGLQRPFSLTRLQFEVRQRDDGSHVVHVSSREPIVEPFLSFLIEIDSPGGNLLREYTVLLDPPVFVSEPRESEAPAATSAAGAESMTATGVPATIERDEDEATPTAAAEPEPEPEPAAEPELAAEPEPEPAVEAVAEPAPGGGDFADTPVFLQVEREDEQAESEAREMAAAEPEPEPEPRASTATTRGYDAEPEEYGPVERGENLWNIASRLKRDDMTVQQMMLALLRYNPDAFIRDNINLLRQGYVLRIPGAEEVLSLSAQRAVARVREQNALWREFRVAARAGGAQRATETRAAADAPEASDEGVAGEDASLKIVGSSEGSGASSDESASATTSGSERTTEELKLAREQLESTRMEKEEFESRVGELEETVDKMERLIEVREDQLARLQEQLRELEQGEEEADAAGTQETAGDRAATDAGGAGAESETAAAGDAESGGDEAVDEETAAVTDDDEAEAVAAADTDGGGGSGAASGSEAGTAGADGAGDSGTEAATNTDPAGDAESTAAASAGAAGTEAGVVTTRTQPADPTWTDRALGIWTSVKATVGGMLAGVTAGVSLGSLLDNPLALPIAGAAVVLLLAGLLLARRRRAENADEAVTVADAPEPPREDEDDPFAALMQTETADDVAVDEDSSEAWDDDTRAAGDDDSRAAESDLMSEEFDLDNLDDEDQTVAAGGSDDETIAEADVYLAYGLHQQAEDLLKLALDEQPDRLDYHAKMLEALYGAGKTDEFVTRAEAFQSRAGDPQDPSWLRAVAMGQELAPDNPLFQQEVDETLKPAGSSATPPPGTDFEVGGDEGDATDLDFTFDEEGAGEVEEADDDEFARTVMVDSDQLGALGGDAGLAGPEADAGSGQEAATATDTGGDEGMDFDLGDLELGDDEGAPATAGGGDAAAPDTTGAGDDEGGLEFELGDLDLDDAGGGDRAGADTGSEEGTDLDLDSLDLAADDSTAAATTSDDDDDSFEMDLGDLDTGGGLDTEAAAGGGDQALDLGDFGADSGAGGDAGDEESFSIEGDDDVSLDDLAGDFDASGGGEVDAGGDEDELDTMLDLARAYIDMGDGESARAALEEVVEAGNDKQRGEANNLLESV